MHFLSSYGVERTHETLGLLTQLMNMTLYSATTFKVDVCILTRAQMWFQQERIRVEIDVKKC